MDYYSILEVTRGAGDAEINRAYRMASMRWHPDRNVDTYVAEEKFLKIAEAFDVLSNKERRAVYDQYGEDGLKNGAQDPEGVIRGGYHFNNNAFEIFEKFFGTANPFADFGFGETLPFTSRLRKPAPVKGEAVVQDLPCTLEELFRGCVKRISITRKRLDSTGRHTKEETKLLTINVRPGWKKGTRVTFPNEGDEGVDIIASDVVFVVRESPHPSFTRQGSTLVFKADVSLVEALVDCTVRVPTLDGRVLSIACNEVVSTEYTKVVVGEGMPLGKSGAPGARGDLKVRFNIRFPQHLTEDRRSLLLTALTGSGPLPKPKPKPKPVKKVEEE